jgi:hypothetical protein
MATVAIDMSELDEVTDYLAKSGGNGATVAHASCIAVGTVVQSQAKAAAPTDRPWLSTEGIRRKSWRDARGSHTDVFTVNDPEGRPSGVFVEYGTSDTPPQAFLTIQAPYAEAALPAMILAKLEVF